MLKDELVEFLVKRPDGMKGRDIAKHLGYDKSEVNSCLYSNKDLFWQDDSYTWYLKEGKYKKKDEEHDEYDDEVLSKLNNSEDAEYFTLEEFNELADWSECISPGDVNSNLYYETQLGNVIECDSKNELILWEYLEDNDLIISGGGQQIPIEYKTRRGSEKNYYPDMVILTKHHHIAIIEVKPVNDMDYHINIAKYKALKQYCEERGYEYMMVDPENDFISFEELLDYPVIDDIIRIFEDNDGADSFYFNQEDVSEWYKLYGIGYTKKEFELMVHSCVAYYDWFNQSKHGFDVNNKTVKYSY